MRNQRSRSALQKGGRGKSSSQDFISNMPYEVLIMILSLLPVKDAVVACSVSPKWRYFWHSLTQLNFDATASLNKIQKASTMSSFDPMDSIYDSERSKYIQQVNSVIQSHKPPMVHRFRVNFDLRGLNQRVIDEWLEFALTKKVEILELDIENSTKVRHLFDNYVFPSTLPDRNNAPNNPSLNARVVELASLKQLYLNNVTMKDEVLQELLTRSPHLESLSIHGSKCLTRIRVGGRCRNLKHIEVTDCFHLRFLYLYEFDLVSFTYKGMPIDLRLTKLPDLKEVNICEEDLVVFQYNLFRVISSCTSSIQVLSLTLICPKRIGKLDSIPQLPNVKKLTLTMGAYEDDSLLEFVSIAEACPSLETFIIKLLWDCPIKIKWKARPAAKGNTFENLKLFKILGYYGRISDLELATYVVDNAVALKEMVIDRRCQVSTLTAYQKDLLKNEKAARSSAKCQLKRIVTMKCPGVKLAIL